MAPTNPRHEPAVTWPLNGAVVKAVANLGVPTVIVLFGCWWLAERLAPAMIETHSRSVESQREMLQFLSIEVRAAHREQTEYLKKILSLMEESQRGRVPSRPAAKPASDQSAAYSVQGTGWWVSMAGEWRAVPMCLG